MTLFYSAATGGFYDDTLRADYEAAGSWPTDLVAVTDEQYDLLMQGQQSGQQIVADEAGQPTLADPPEPTREEVIARADSEKRALMEAAAAAISPLQDAVELEMATAEEQARLTAWKKYRILLSRIDPADAPDIDWPTPPA